VRDENFHRDTQRGKVKKGTYAPMDMEAGGTWLSYNKVNQRFAVILNNDDPMCDSDCATKEEESEVLKSRGVLPAMFTESTITPTTFLKDIKKIFGNFHGFSLIFGDNDGCHYVSNRCVDSPVRLEPNVLHGFSNGAISAPPEAWPRLAVGKSVIESQIHDLSLTSVHDENEIRRNLQQLMEGFKSNEYVNPDISMHSTCHERLILPPTYACDQDNYLYGTRTLTAFATFGEEGVEEEREEEEGNNGDRDRKGKDRGRSGVLVLESDLDPVTREWSDQEHVLC
jgi:uncharacterized protein with NRDE domain